MKTSLRIIVVRSQWLARSAIFVASCESCAVLCTVRAATADLMVYETHVSVCIGIITVVDSRIQTQSEAAITCCCENEIHTAWQRNHRCRTRRLFSFNFPCYVSLFWTLTYASYCCLLFTIRKSFVSVKQERNEPSWRTGHSLVNETSQHRVLFRIVYVLQKSGYGLANTYTCGRKRCCSINRTWRLFLV